MDASGRHRLEGKPEAHPVHGPHDPGHSDADRQGPGADGLQTVQPATDVFVVKDQPHGVGHTGLIQTGIADVQTHAEKIRTPLILPPLADDRGQTQGRLQRRAHSPGSTPAPVQQQAARDELALGRHVHSRLVALHMELPCQQVQHRLREAGQTAGQLRQSGQRREHGHGLHKARVMREAGVQQHTRDGARRRIQHGVQRGSGGADGGIAAQGIGQQLAERRRSKSASHHSSSSPPNSREISVSRATCVASSARKAGASSSTRLAPAACTAAMSRVGLMSRPG